MSSYVHCKWIKAILDLFIAPMKFKANAILVLYSFRITSKRNGVDKSVSVWVCGCALNSHQRMFYQPQKTRISIIQCRRQTNTQTQTQDSTEMVLLWLSTTKNHSDVTRKPLNKRYSCISWLGGTLSMHRMCLLWGNIRRRRRWWPRQLYAAQQWTFFRFHNDNRAK